MSKHESFAAKGCLIWGGITVIFGLVIHEPTFVVMGGSLMAIGGVTIILFRNR